MKKGSKARVTCGYDLLYGKRGNKEVRAEPYADFLFKLHVLGHDDAPDDNEIIPPMKVHPEMSVDYFEQGEGPQAEEGQTVDLNYQIFTEDNEELRTQSSELSVEVGTGVLPCLKDALMTGVRVGSKLRVICPPDTAFGYEERGGIEADSTISFILDIKDIRETPRPEIEYSIEIHNEFEGVGDKISPGGIVSCDFKETFYKDGTVSMDSRAHREETGGEPNRFEF